MNLDIMTLMAASAAAANTSDADTAAPLAADGDSDSAAPFATVLQALKDLSANPLEGAAATADEALTVSTADPLGVGADLMLPPGLAVPLDPEATAQTGESLPPTGQTLPLTVVEEDTPDTLLASLATAPAGDTTLPSAKPLDPFALEQRLSPAMTTAPNPAATAQRAEQALGWYSSSAAPGNATVPSAPTSAAVNPDLLDTATASTRTPAVAAAAAEPETALLQTQDTPTRPQAIATTTANVTLNASAAEPLELLQTTPTDGPRASTTGQGAADLRAAPSMAERLPTPPPLALNRPGWDRGFSEHITMMASRGVESAELRLDPPQLGTVHVKLTVQGDQAQLVVQAQAGAVREAMETAMPRLREMLDAEGLTLDSAHVAERDESGRKDTQHETGGTSAEEDLEADVDTRTGLSASDAELTHDAGRLYVRV